MSSQALMTYDNLLQALRTASDHIASDERRAAPGHDKAAFHAAGRALDELGIALVAQLPREDVPAHSWMDVSDGPR